MKINVLIDNHLPVDIENYDLKAFSEDELERFVAELSPNRLTVFSYGHDGWAQFDSSLNPSPPGLKYDLPAVWKRIALRHGCDFALYVSTLRNDILLRKNPDWQRFTRTGLPTNRIDHTSPYWETWLKPALQELWARYQPDGFFFDGDYWTVGDSIGPWRLEAARRKFPKRGENPLASMDVLEDRALTVETYGEYLRKLGEFLAPIAPRSSVNVAFSFRHPMTPPPGLGLVTSDLPPFFAALDCWLETSVLTPPEVTREVVAPLFVEPEGGGRKYRKTVEQLLHEVAPIAVAGDAIHVYFPMNSEGHIQVGYANVLKELAAELARLGIDAAAALPVLPDVFCLADGELLGMSQNFGNLRGAAVAAAAAGLNSCVATVEQCRARLGDIRLLIISEPPSASARQFIEAARAMGAAVFEADFGRANRTISSEHIEELQGAYRRSGRPTFWSRFEVSRPVSALVRGFHDADGRWRLLFYSAVERGYGLGRHVTNAGAGSPGEVSLRLPPGAIVDSILGYASNATRSGDELVFTLAGAFALIEGRAAPMGS